MKRYGNLWPALTDFSNLLDAARKAQKGKRFRENVLAFNYHLEREVVVFGSSTLHVREPAGGNSPGGQSKSPDLLR